MTSVAVTTSDGKTKTLTAGTSITDAALSSAGYTLKSITLGSTLTARVATISDADSGCAISDYSTTVSWGDGSTSPGSLAAGSAACSFDVTGSHTYPNSGTYTITVTTNDVGGASTIATSSLSVAPIPTPSPTPSPTSSPPPSGITMTPSYVTFANEYPGTPAPSQSVTITNAGSQDLPITSNTIALIGSGVSDFGETNNCGTSLAAGSSCTVTVTFTPSIIGTRYAALNLIAGPAQLPLHRQGFKARAILP